MSWKIPTYLLPPPRAPIEVERERVSSRLDSAFERMVVLLQAPAGYGKSTALAHWWASRRQTHGERIAWINLELIGADIGAFLDAVALALGQPEPEHAVATAAAPDGNALRRERTPQDLVAGLRHDDAPFILILDECHRVRAPLIWRALRSLLQHAGGALHVILALRGHLPFASAQWAAHGLLEEIGYRELAFTQGELLNLAQRLDPGAAARCDQVHAQTQGWPVAARLALDTTGGKRTWSAYVDEQILHDLPPWARSILEDLAHLGRFDAGLLDAVRGRGDAARILEAPELTEGLLVNEAHDPHFWRVQPCLASMLCARSAPAKPQRVRSLHRAAAEYLVGQGDLLHGARHAMASDDAVGAVKLLEQAGGWELVILHGTETARELLAIFPSAMIQAKPSLRLIRAYLALKAGAVDSANAEIDNLANLPEAQSEPFARDLRLLRALALAYADGAVDASRLREFESQLQQLRSDDHLGRAVLSCVCAVGALGQGHFSAARMRALDGMQAMLAAGSAFGAMHALVHAGQAACHAGDLRRAEALFRECLAQVPQHQGDRDTAMALGRCLLAQPLYWRGQLDEAAEAVLPAMSMLTETDGWFDVYASAFHSAMLVLTARGDADATWVLLDRAARIGRRRNLLRLLDMCDAWQLTALLRLRRLDEAQAYAAQFGLERRWRDCAGSTSAWRAYLELGTGLAMLALETGHNASASRIAYDTATLARTLDAHLVFVQCQLLRAAALDALQAGPEAQVALTDAIDYAYAQRAPRVLSDCGPQAQGLLYRILAGADTPQLSPTQRLWLSKYFAGSARAHDSDALLLSHREESVLRELCLGHSNKSIGRMLGMTENTVKFHLKCAYRKLGVRTRSGAVAAMVAMHSPLAAGVEKTYPVE